MSRSSAKLMVKLMVKLAGTSWGASTSTLHTSALALCYSVAEYCCPVWARSSYTNLIDSSTPNFIVQCAWFQSACNPHDSHGCQCSAMLHLLLYAVKRQPKICFRSSKSIQIGLCMLMSLSIHLHGLHLDAQYGQTWHLLTQLRSEERTGRRLLWSTTLLLPTLVSNGLVSICLVIHGRWWTISSRSRHMSCELAPMGSHPITISDTPVCVVFVVELLHKFSIRAADGPQKLLKVSAAFIFQHTVLFTG